FFAFSVPSAWGQNGAYGSLNVTVLDESGAVVPNAQLTIVDTTTGDVRKATTGAEGTSTFVGLPLGVYRLTVSKGSFQTQVYDSVVVQGGRVTDLKALLKVGPASQEVVVSGSVSPLAEATSNAIVTTIDMKQIQDLPLSGRNINQLAFLTPGYSGTPSSGTWNGLPMIAQGNTIDGVVSSTSRMKFAGNTNPGLQARVEDIQEMTVQTSQVDLSQALGGSSMQTSFVTRRGSNAYHGGVYEDFRNSWLNANSWRNNAVGVRRPNFILNDFGGSVGGPVLKNKLFFFGSFAMSKQPGGFVTNNVFLSQNAQKGIYTYQPPNSATTVNLFTQVAQPNGLPTAPTVTYLAEQAAINTAVTSGGATISSTGDPNTEQVNWLVQSPVTQYFPAVRLDYNVSPKVRLNFAFEETKRNQPNAAAPVFPGAAFANQAASNKSSDYIGSLGLDWSVTPTLLNQFRGGYFYNAYWYGFGAKPLWDTQPLHSWAIADSGTGFNLPVSTYYPIFNASDNATWQHSAHTVTFGFSFYREQDHYWNPPDGIQNISLGLVNGDPAFGDFENYFASASNTDRSEAENLYATLIGRVASVGPIGSGFPYQPATGKYATTPGQAYNLDELQKSWGVYVQDAYRLRPSLTLNYGLRWDFTGDNHDLTSAYHGATATDMFGPSGVGNLFKPGTLTGNANPQYVASSHQYHPWNVSPQPMIGLAWNPNYSEGFLGKLFSGGNTVIRAGFDIKRFTEPYQYFWNNASNHGMAFFQNFSYQAGGGSGPGFFKPGSLTDTGGNFSPTLFLNSPPAYAASIPQSDFTWSYYWGAAGFDPDIKQPYVQEWNLGVQRQFGNSNVLEVRYMGHRSVHQWINVNTNEVNIVENGFLNEFKNAQTNMAINQAHGIKSFANNGYAGQQPLPIFDAAFAGEASGGTGIPFKDYGPSGGFFTRVQQGQAGAAAATLAKPFGSAPYICNLVGSSISNCATQFGFTSPGKYPLNFFQSNPYAASCDGCSTQSFMTAGGYGNYHALLVDFRERPWHGMQFDVNYTWSHTLGLQPDNQWLGTVPEFTIRDLRLGYGPTLFDLRHVIHASGTYDLPFGNGRAFLNHTGVINQIVGGWTLGTIFTYETGFPFQLTGSYRTFNEYGDGGLVLNGITRSQLQSATGVYTPNICGSGGNQTCPFKWDFNPSILRASNKIAPPANCNSFLTGVCQNTTPGTFTGDPWLYGPHLWNEDLSITKLFPITERVQFVFQGELLNAFNHPNWANPNGRLQSSSFGQAGLSNMNGPRQIEFRARLDF
ncbi:MAG TPA: carboxypeptidase regulatory-like domain-containing protein, partial [Candidatus Sulfotelmatobacter sp.]|nr:carboxypeptidase regulatory-like domain-containing protein [Candidatus Sulfotelmatobacter sp.]